MRRNREQNPYDNDPTGQSTAVHSRLADGRPGSAIFMVQAFKKCRAPASNFRVHGRADHRPGRWPPRRTACHAGKDLGRCGSGPVRGRQANRKGARRQFSRSANEAAALRVFPGNGLLFWGRAREQGAKLPANCRSLNRCPKEVSDLVLMFADFVTCKKCNTVISYLHHFSTVPF